MINFRNRKCKICGKDFKPNSPVTKYCFDCRTFTCKQCGKKFVIRESFIPSRNTKFCSLDCYLQNRWGSKNCPICGKPNKRTNHRYCSKECAKIGNKQSGQRSKGRKAQYYKNYKSKLFNYLGNKCQVCGFDNVLALDIHHPNGKKKQWKRNQNRWVRYWKERKSIQLICANCHRIIHHSPFQ